jgi:hypothetical protein
MTPESPEAVSAAAVPQARGEQTYRGTFRFGFELQSFEGCWIEITRFLDRFEAPPWGSGGVSSYEIEFVGTREDIGDVVLPPELEHERRGFGHMGASRCRFIVKELRSSRRLG